MKAKKLAWVLSPLLFLGVATAASARVHDGMQAKADQPCTLAGLLQTLNDLRDLASQYQLTDEQKSQIRTLVLKNLPAGQSLIQQMLANRFDLLDLTAGQREYDREKVEAIADAQAELTRSLILWKEDLKAEIRTVLDDDQLAFVEEMVQLFIEHRMEGQCMPS